MSNVNKMFFKVNAYDIAMYWAGLHKYSVIIATARRRLLYLIPGTRGLFIIACNRLNSCFTGAF